MTTVINNGHKVELQDNVQELPISRYIEFQRHLLADSNVGSTAEDVDVRIQRMMGFIDRDEKDSAKIEAQNLRLALRNTIAKLSPKMMAFCMLVESIDGVPVTDYSDSGLKRISMQLEANKLTWATAMNWIQNVKKK